MPVDERIARLERAQKALMAHNAEHGGHECDEYIEKDYEGNDDGCEICWSIAIDVDRALRNATVCERCRGTGQPGPEGDACDECDGSGEFDPADV